MATSQVSEVIQHLRRAVEGQGKADRTDGQLLEEFIGHRDEMALATLIQRHGPMVWGVCQRILPHHHDAEDAFQATFLVLVRKASSIVPRGMVANWLYGVAHQTALKLRATIARRTVRERQVTIMPEPATADQEAWRVLKPVLDEELSRLPDRYRAVIVLCDLEGKTRKDAARQIGCPEGTVAGWLARARILLARRLARHGLAISSGSLAELIEQQAASAVVPKQIITATIQAVTRVAAGQPALIGATSAKINAVTEGVMKTMFRNELKSVAIVVMIASAFAAGTTGLIHRALAASPGETASAKPPEHENKGSPATEDDKKAQPTEEARATKPEEDRLDGQWVAESSEIDGVADGVKKRPLSWGLNKKGEGYTNTDQPRAGTRRRPDETQFDFKYTFDSTAKPKTIDLIPEEGRAKGKTLRGIYSLEGDEFKICYVSPNTPDPEKKPRPTEFAAKKGSGYVLLVFRLNALDETILDKLGFDKEELEFVRGVLEHVRRERIISYSKRTRETWSDVNSKEWDKANRIEHVWMLAYKMESIGAPLPATVIPPLEARLMGKPAPALAGSSWHNTAKPLDWNDLKGKVVLLDFLKEGCAPCVESLAALQALQKRFGEKGFVVVCVDQRWNDYRAVQQAEDRADEITDFLNEHGIAAPCVREIVIVLDRLWRASEEAEERVARVTEFLKKRDITLPFVVDTGKTFEGFGIETTPTYLLVDRTGKVIPRGGIKLHSEPTAGEIEAFLKR